MIMPRTEHSTAPLGLRWLTLTFSQAGGLGWHRTATLWRKSWNRQPPTSKEIHDEPQPKFAWKV